MGLAFNELVKNGEVKAPIVIGRDHLGCGSVASPNRETEGMLDGSDAVGGGRSELPPKRSEWTLGKPPPRWRGWNRLFTLTLGWSSSPMARTLLLDVSVESSKVIRHGRRPTPSTPGTTARSILPMSAAWFQA